MRDIFLSLKIVFNKKKYIFLSVITFFFLLIINSLLINKGAISFVLNVSYLDLSTKFKIVLNALFNTFSFFNELEIIMMFIIMLLTSINISMLLFFLINKIRKGVDRGLSIAGIIISFLGIGCASCGLVIISSIIGFSATVSLLVFLPFNGIEFYLLSSLFICSSITLISKKIMNPLFCKINTLHK